MNINEKVYKKKSPEAIALEATIAHYLLFCDKDLEYINKKAETQANVEIDLELVAALIQRNIEAAKAVKDYVR